MGFRVLEVNSSEKRTGQLITGRFKEATQSKRVAASSDAPVPPSSLFFGGGAASAATVASAVNAKEDETTTALLFEEVDFAFDDACGAVIAGLAGPAGAPYAAAWRNRSAIYRNVWNAQAGAMCPRFRNGTFPTCPPLDLPPILLNEYYTEGDGLQYTWSVPHDTAGLLGLFPSAANYTALLSTLMVNTPLWPTNALPNPFYWAGNEPDVLAPWQFSLVPGEEWRTQYWVRWILDTYYPLAADGVPGNDDLGELNSWAVWACLGLYPLTATPGGTYILSSPCFKDVSLGPPSAPLLRVLAHNFSAASVYVVNATLNGLALPSPFVNHSALLAGSPSLLEFFLTDTPVRWGGGAPAVWD